METEHEEELAKQCWTPRELRFQQGPKTDLQEEYFHHPDLIYLESHR